MLHKTDVQTFLPQIGKTGAGYLDAGPGPITTVYAQYDVRRGLLERPGSSQDGSPS